MIQKMTQMITRQNLMITKLLKKKKKNQKKKNRRKKNKPQSKIIYKKNKDRLKDVNFDKGVIFNQVLNDTENDTNDNKAESNDNNTVEKDKEESKEQKQKSEVEGFTEYSILDKKL